MLFENDRHSPYTNKISSTSEWPITITSILNNSLNELQKSIWLPASKLDIDNSNDTVKLGNIYFGNLGVLWTLDKLASIYKVNKPNIEKIIFEIKAESVDFEKEPSSFLLNNLVACDVLLSILQNNPISAKQIKNWQNNVQENLLYDPLYGVTGLLQLSTNLRKLNLLDKEAEQILINLFNKTFNAVNLSDEGILIGWPTQFKDEIKYFNGAAHGSAGIIEVLYNFAKEFKVNGDLEKLKRWASELVNEKSITSEGGANWPKFNQEEVNLENPMLLHWCHGAPGIILSLSEIVWEDSEARNIIKKAAHTIYQAGPLNKGPGICHGTSGNALAVLKVYQLSNDEKYLNMAIELLNEAIDQFKNSNEKRFSLWTGDLGLAWAIHCFAIKRVELPCWHVL